MGCSNSTTNKRNVSINGKAYADGMDVDAVAGYLRDPRNWIPHLLEGNGGTGVVCALQGPGTDAVSFTFQVRAVHHHRGTAHRPGSTTMTHQTASGSAQVKRVDVQGDSAVVEVFTNFSTNTSSHYTYTLQRASNTSSSGTTIEATVVTTYEMPLVTVINIEKEARNQLQEQTDALMIRLAAVLSSPVVQGQEATGMQVPPMGDAI